MWKKGVGGGPLSSPQLGARGMGCFWLLAPARLPEHRGERRGASGLGGCSLILNLGSRPSLLRSAPRGHGGLVGWGGGRAGPVAVPCWGEFSLFSRAFPTFMFAFCRLFAAGRPRPAVFWPG